MDYTQVRIVADAIRDGLGDIASAIRNSGDATANSIHALGHNRAGTNMGAIEAFTVALREMVSSGAGDIADAIRDAVSGEN